MGVLDDLRNMFGGGNTQSFGWQRPPDQRMRSQIPDRNALANANIINVPNQAGGPDMNQLLMGGPALPEPALNQQGGPGVVSDFNFSRTTGEPVNTNEFVAKPGATILDQIQAGQADTDSKSLFDLIGSNSDADKYLALALGGFSMAEAAGKPGATFLTSLGAGGKAGIAGAIAARTAARKEATAQTLARAKLAAARAKKLGTPSTMAKEISESTGFPIGSVGHMNAMSKALGTRELSKLPNAMQIATLLNPGADPETIHADAQKIAFGSVGSMGERMATRMGEIEKEKPTTYRTDPEYIKVKGLYEAAISDWRGVKQMGQATKEAAALKAKIDSPLHKQMAKRTGEIVEKADSALRVMQPVGNIEETLMSGTVATGGGQEFFTNIQSALSTLNIDYNKWAKKLGLSVSKLSDSQYMRSQGNSIVANILSGKAFGNNPSNKDLEFIVQMVQGLGVDEVANIKIGEFVFKNYKRLTQDGIRVMARSENRLYGRNASKGVNSETMAMKNKLQGYEDARQLRFNLLRGQMQDQWEPLTSQEKDFLLNPGSSLTTEQQILRRKARIYMELLNPKYNRVQRN